METAHENVGMEEFRRMFRRRLLVLVNVIVSV